MDATVASLESQLTALQQNIDKLNQSLLGGDSFQQLNATVPADSALVQAITGAYPSLFQTGVFSGTALHANSDALLAAGQAQAAQFLAQAESDTLPTANSPDAPMAATIAQLEEQLRTLQGQIEVERGRNLQFTEAARPHLGVRQGPQQQAGRTAARTCRRQQRGASLRPRRPTR